VKSKQVLSAYETTNPSTFKSLNKLIYNINKIEFRTHPGGTLPYPMILS